MGRVNGKLTVQSHSFEKTQSTGASNEGVCTTKVRIKETENTVNKSIRRMCLHLADLHITLHFKLLYSRQLADYLICKYRNEKEIWLWTASSEGLAKGNRSIFHNFIIVLPEKTKEIHWKPLASNFADIWTWYFPINFRTWHLRGNTPKIISQ